MDGAGAADMATATDADMATAGVDTDTDELDTATAVVDMLADVPDTVAQDAPVMVERMVAARALDLAADALAEPMAVEHVSAVEVATQVVAADMPVAAMATDADKI